MNITMFIILKGSTYAVFFDAGTREMIAIVGIEPFADLGLLRIGNGAYALP